MDDFVLATNEFHSVEKAFATKNITIKWKEKGLDEVGYDEKTNRVYVKVNEKYFRLAEVDELLGDPTKAITTLKWQPKYSFDQLVEEMMEMDQ